MTDGAIDPDAAGFDPAAVDALREKVRQQVDEGRMPACQFAFAVDGELALFESFGSATPTTLLTENCGVTHTGVAQDQSTPPSATRPWAAATACCP